MVGEIGESSQEPWLELVMGWRGGGPRGVQPSPDSWLRQTGCLVAPSVKTGTMEGVRLQSNSGVPSQYHYFNLLPNRGMLLNTNLTLWVHYRDRRKVRK